MQAIRVTEFGGPEVLRLVELPDPAPGPGQVVVKLHAVGVNPVDTYLRTGQHAHAPKLPWTPGADGAGVVAAIGEGVTGWKAGDRCYTSGALTGTYAEQALCRAAQLHHLPARLSFAQGAAIGVPYATAWRALFQKANARPGETVFIHGASGGVGTAAVQLAKAAGMIVIGSAGTEAGRAEVLKQGAHHVLDHRAADYLAQLSGMTAGKGPAVILELLANVNLGHDLAVLAQGGRVVVIGSRGPVEIMPRHLMTKDASIIGMSLFNANEVERAEIHAALGAGFANGTLFPLVGAELPLAEAPRAHLKVMEPGARGKIVLIP